MADPTPDITKDLEKKAAASAQEKLSTLYEEVSARERINSIVAAGETNALHVLDTYKEQEKVIKDQEEALDKLSKSAKNIVNIFDKELNTALVKTVSGIKEAVVELPKVEKLLEAIGKAIPGGAALKFITDMLAVAGEATWGWYQHLGPVNRQLYDINASLGNMGSKAQVFEESIAKFAWSLRISVDDARKLAGQMANIGMEQSSIKEHLVDVVALSTLWTEISPEKQMKMMSDYMKEFGYTGDKAWATMFAIYDTSKSLKVALAGSAFDMGKFAEQTHEVALGMRKYGLEASDALVLTSALARMKIEQGRIPELAMQLGATGLGSPAVLAEMGLHKMIPAYTQELAGIKEKQQKFPERILEPKELVREAFLKETLAKTKGGEGTVGGLTATQGTFATLPEEERMKFQMGHLDEMIRAATGGAGISGKGPEATSEQLVGALSQIELPGIGKMTIEMANAFAKGIENLKSTDKNMTLLEAFEKQHAETMAETARHKKADIEAAKNAAAATTSSAESLKNIEGLLGQWFMRQFGVSAEADIAATEVKKRGEIPSLEWLSAPGTGKEPSIAETKLEKLKEEYKHAQEVYTYTKTTFESHKGGPTSGESKVLRDLEGSIIKLAAKVEDMNITVNVKTSDQLESDISKLRTGNSSMLMRP